MSLAMLQVVKQELKVVLRDLNKVPFLQVIKEGVLYKIKQVNYD